MTGQHAALGGTRAGDRLLVQKERILQRWEERLRAEVTAASGERHPILIDTLPAVLRQFAEALSDRHPRPLGTAGSTVAEEHGGERVRVTSFRLQDVVSEYRLLREVIFEILEEEAPLASHERSSIHGSIDQAITKACTAFMLVHEGMREQFFATLAHDLRTPLSAARASAGLILRRQAAEHVPRWAARAIDNIDRVDKMVQDLLDAFRLQATTRFPLSLEECDLVEIARESVEHLQAEHGERLVLTAPGPVQGHFARQPLRRAIENLASNAVKYGEAHRPITVRVHELHQRALITVHNHGGHIPAEQQETLFRAFHRLRQAESGRERGWGLGLAQVRGVAEAHGGSIAVDSLPERGTTFIIDIPCDARPFQGRPPPPLSDR